MPTSSNRALILKRFKEIGLSSNEVKGYLTLLERRTLTVPEVSKLAGIPLPNTYRALESLMSKGLCVSRPGPTKKYSAADPSLLEDKLLSELNSATQMELDNLRKKEKQILEKAKVVKESIGAMIGELKPQYEESRLETNPMDFIEVIKDPYQMHKRFMQLTRESKREILSFSKPPYSVPGNMLREQAEQKLEPHQKRMKIRCIYELPKDEEQSEWLYETIEASVREREEARVIEKLPMKMAIFDSRIVIMGLVDPISKGTSLTTQVVEHPTLAESLKMLFESLWEQAKDYRVLKDPGR
jgi:sugar-specific transcriptional regulator TrmB